MDALKRAAHLNALAAFATGLPMFLSFLREVLS
jgi:hypothetical protein